MTKQRAADTSVVARSLHCRIGKTPIAVSAEAIEQIIDYDVASPAPLASQWIAGIGIHAEKLVVSVSLAPRARGSVPRRRRARGVVLKAPESRAGFAIEVSQVLSLVDLTIVELPLAASELGLPTWLLEGSTASGQKLGWIDANAMIREFDAVLGS
jgi:chemotaxis signal transduction protein